MMWVILGILAFSGLCFMALHLEEQHHRRMEELTRHRPPDGPHGPPDDPSDGTPPQA